MNKIIQGQGNIISEDLIFGENLELGHYNIIENGVVIGKNCYISNFAIIENNVKMGDNCYISDYAKLPEGTVLGNNVRVGGWVRTGINSVVGDNVVLKAKAILGPNAKVGAGTTIGPYAILLHGTHKGESYSTSVGERCYVGCHGTIAPGCTIGDDVVVGALAFVPRSISEKGVYVGLPAKKILRHDDRKARTADMKWE